jgi:hypothetical protein
MRLPANCRDGSRVTLAQAIIRQFSGVSGTDRIVYAYVPEILDEMEATHPLQLSYLLVHEWLWSLSGNVERNRRVNRYLHTEEFLNASRSELIDQLEGMGLSVVGAQKTLAADGSGDYATLDDALEHSPDGTTLRVKEGRYLTSGAIVGRAIRILGVGRKENTLILGVHSEPALTIVASVGAQVRLSGLTFGKAVPTDPTGWQETVRVQSGAPRIDDCVFEGSGRTGLLVGGTATPDVSGNDFFSLRRGIVLLGSAAGRYENNRYSGNNLEIEWLSRGKPDFRESPQTRIERGED